MHCLLAKTDAGKDGVFRAATGPRPFPAGTSNLWDERPLSPSNGRRASHPRDNDPGGSDGRAIRGGRSFAGCVRRYLPALACLLAYPLTVTDAAAADTEPLHIETRNGACHRFEVEMALSPQAQQTGLSRRPHLEKGHGMLFGFQRNLPVTMWMKDTWISLDMLFVREDGTVAGIHARAEPMSKTLLHSPEPVRAVLEIEGGEAERLGIRPGDRLHHRLFNKPDTAGACGSVLRRLPGPIKSAPGAPPPTAEI